MKRVLHYKTTDEGYGCFEDEEIVFLIRNDDLKFNVKEFYQAFYSEGKDFEDIVIENDAPDNKDAARIYQCIISLIAQIDGRIKELSDEVSEVDVEEELEADKEK
jgi:hypothetical protein